MTCDGRVLVDDVAHRIDELDDQLGDAISRRCLAAEDERAWVISEVRITLQPVIKRDHVKTFRCWRLYS